MASVLITGAGRRTGIAAACARTLAAAGWDVGLSCWRPADRESGLPGDDGEPSELAAELRELGVRAELVEVDLADPAAPALLFDQLEARLGSFTALVASHCRDVELPLLRTSAEEFDRHFAVNARSVAGLIQELANRLPGNDGRVVAFTSDALSDNVPYGASKGALDRIVKVAASELGSRGIRANCVNPGPTETGWITDDLRDQLAREIPLARPSLPQDSANLVEFLLSPEGGWITGQLLHSNGGHQ
ncbi:MAG: SDR family oxidoreductase [Gaiellales bacterium]|jgi:3-oxoacyl-[acyl-carrier protein] reductase